MRTLITAARRRTIRTALLAGAALAVTSAAIAQYGRDDDQHNFGDEDTPLRLKSDYFGYSASISPRAGYTTNIDLSPDGFKEGSAYFSTVFQGSAIYSKPRLTGIVSGTLDLSYIAEGSDFGVNQDIGGAATATIAENLFMSILPDRRRASSSATMRASRRTSTPPAISARTSIPILQAPISIASSTTPRMRRCAIASARSTSMTAAWAPILSAATISERLAFA